MNNKKKDIKLIEYKEAGLYQMNAANFDCEIVDLAVAGGGNARIEIEGLPENLQRLYDYVNGAMANENKKAPTV